MSHDRAVCILGCRSGSATLARRTRVGRDVFLSHEAALVVACGGRSWGGRIEADEMARMLRELGVPDEKIARERSSKDTKGNARHAKDVLAARGIRDVLLVTCAWHLPRATRLFERAGLHVVHAVPVPTPHQTLFHRAYVHMRERVSMWKDAYLP